jgi:IclR family acetate operon transcriptional repressor
VSVQSIDRAVQILRCFSPRTPALGISDISRTTGLSTSTVHRLLGALLANRLVRQTADRRYALGPLLVQLVRGGAAPTTLRDAALPTMTALRDAVDETVGLHELLPSDERAVLEQVESHQPLRRTYTEFGVPIPLTYGAPGKIMLAMLDEPRREAILRRPIAPVTRATITDPDALRAELRRDRERRFAFSLAERTPGIRTVAAPIFDAAGEVTGCLSVSGPEVRMPKSRLNELAPLVRDAAFEVSEILGATADAVERRLTDAGSPGRAPTAARRAP